MSAAQNIHLYIIQNNFNRGHIRSITNKYNNINNLVIIIIDLYRIKKI